jgi:hypothetical protein
LKAIKFFYHLFKDFFVLWKVWRNQRQIIKTAHSSTRRIYIDAKPLLIGSIDHYYHAIFDLFLPLSLLIKKAPTETTFLLPGIGPMTKTLLKIFPQKVQVCEGNQKACKVKLLGMDPNGLGVFKFKIQSLREVAFQNLNIKRSQQRNLILLVERVAPDEYYLTTSKAKTSGNWRRSITNHQQLQEMIGQEIYEGYEFRNVVLEEMSIEDQISHFHSAAVVIAQHGAGLANIIWMEKNGIVVEFGLKALPHFKKICKGRHTYLEYGAFEECHIRIDIEEFRRWLYAQAELKKYLRYESAHDKEFREIECCLDH